MTKFDPYLVMAEQRIRNFDLERHGEPLAQPHPARVHWDDVFEGKPTIKYGRAVVWPGGYQRKLSLRELFLWHVGLLRTVRP